MRGILRDFKDVPAIWGSVLLVLTTVQCVMGTMLIMISNARAAGTVPSLHDKAATFVMELSGPPLLPMIVVGVIMVYLVVSLAIHQRRRAFALLALQGATPAQLMLRACVQVLALDVVATLVSLAASPWLARGLYPFATAQLESAGLPFMDESVSATGAAWLIGALGGFLMAFVAGLLTIRSMARIAPVEALRESADPPRTAGPIRLALAGLAGTGAPIVLAFGVLHVKRTSMARMTVQVTFSSMSPLAYAAMIAMLLYVVAICFAGASALSGAVRAWSGVIRIPVPAWRIARQQMSSRVSRASGAIVPLTAGLTLLMSYESLASTISAWLAKIPGPAADFEVPGFLRIVALIGTSLIVVLAAVCAGYLIAQSGRDLDLALLAISGATRGQLHAIAALDGLMMVLTASLLAFIPSALITLAFGIGVYRSFGVIVVGVPWKMWLMVVAVLAVCATVGSWLTARRGIDASPVSVIAQGEAA